MEPKIQNVSKTYPEGVQARKDVTLTAGHLGRRREREAAVA